MKNEPRLTPAEKHIRSLGKLGVAALHEMNSYRRLIYSAVVLLREFKRPYSRYYAPKFKALQIRDQETLIKTMFPLRNLKKIELKEAA